MDVSLALVNTTVTDPYGRLVTGLEAENFRIFEDDVEQEITTFLSEDVPVSIGVVFDMSGSMSDKVEKARQAAIQFMKTANPLDEFFLVTFNDTAEFSSPFTSDINDLESRMLFTSAKGRAALLDAIYLGLSELKGARNTKRALLIISDGGDNHSRYSETEIRNFLKEANCQFSPSASSTCTIWGGRSRKGTGRRCCTNYLSEMSGGQGFSVGNLNELPDIATKISMELRNQYVLGYKPSDVRHNGTWRKIKIKSRPPRVCRLSTSSRKPDIWPLTQ